MSNDTQLTQAQTAVTAMLNECRIVRRETPAPAVPAGGIVGGDRMKAATKFSGGGGVDLVRKRRGGSIMRLLDLFCGAGGAGMGYHLAGFEVVGVDINPQPNYPFEFVHGDAFEYLAKHGHEYDVIHASPPCQEYTKASKQWRSAGKKYKDMVAQTRDSLKKSGKPYIIENVPGSPLIEPTLLNGAMFGMLVARKRLFETSFPLPFILLPPDPPAVKMGRPVCDGDVIQPVGHFSGVEYAKKQMGIDWMIQKELAQAIPPAYTEWIGKQFLK